MKKIQTSRRRFLAGTPLAAAAAANRPYDLLVRGGHVVDPASGISATRDIAIAGGRIREVAANLSPDTAARVIDARGKVVTPGLIDIHVHVYDGVAPLGIPADPNCVARGVTTVVDAGSAGAHTFPGFRQHVLRIAQTRVYALLNISALGQTPYSAEIPYGELLDLRYANPKLAAQTIERNRDAILGVKIRLSRNIADDHDVEALALARDAADAVGLPVMVHIGDTHSPLPRILAMLKPGDVITHSFRAGDGGILDERGRVLAEVKSAVERGVRLDVGHGAAGFSFTTAERARQQGVTPGTISSDVHNYNVNGPVFDLATTLSKFLLLGFSLEEVIERSTTAPARTFAFPAGTGTLRPGGEADIAIFDYLEGRFEFVDSRGEKRTGTRRLVPAITVKSGHIYGAATATVEPA